MHVNACQCFFRGGPVAQVMSFGPSGERLKTVEGMDVQQTHYVQQHFASKRIHTSWGERNKHIYLQ